MARPPHRYASALLRPLARFARSRRQAWAAVSLVLLLGAGALVVSLHNGFPATSIRLAAGSAWLASNQVGELTLLDGTSAEVVTHKGVGKPGDLLVAAQQGTTGYALDETDASVTRIDGATFDTTRTRRLFSQPSVDLRLITGPDELFAVDGQRGLLVRADPGTLAPRGQPQPLAARPAQDLSAVDPNGRLWVLNPVTHELVWFDTGQRHRRPDAVAHAGSLLTLAGGRPVLIDPASQRADLLDPKSGDVAKSIPVDLRPDDQVKLTGGTDSDRIYVVVQPRGLFYDCSFSAAGCDNPLRIGSIGDRLGPAVESSSHLVIPDYTTGQAWIVDLDSRQTVAKRILDRPVLFDLIAKDGFIFYNDPASEQAGVIWLDGSVHKVDKYEPVRVGGGKSDIRAKGGKQTPPPNEPRQPDSAEPAAPNSGPSIPGESLPGSDRPGQTAIVRVQIVLRPGSHGVVGDRFEFTVHTSTGQPIGTAQWTFGDETTGTGTTVPHAFARAGTFQVAVRATVAGQPTVYAASVPVMISPPATPPRISQINIDPRTNLLIGQTATFSAEVTGTRPDRWTWTILGPAGATEASSTQPRFSHTFRTAGSYQVALTVSTPSGSDRQSVTMTVSPPNIRCGETITRSLIANTSLTCPADGLTIGADNVTLDLGGHTLAGGGTGQGVVISGRQGVTVTNGAVARFNPAIHIVSSQDVKISRLTVGSDIFLGDSSGNSTGIQRITMDRIDLTGTLSANAGPQSVSLTNSSVTNGGVDFWGLDERGNPIGGSYIIKGNTLTNSPIGFGGINNGQIVGNTINGQGVTYSELSTGIISGNRFQNATVTFDESPGNVVVDNVFTNRGIFAWHTDRLTIRNNEISGAPDAGIRLDGGFNGLPVGVEIVGNTLRSNGQPAVNPTGRTVNDGLWVDAPTGSDILVANNHTFDNAEYGIEALPGTVRDGGGNTSSGDPKGCLGVVCG